MGVFTQQESNIKGFVCKSASASCVNWASGMERGHVEGSSCSTLQEHLVQKAEHELHVDKEDSDLGGRNFPSKKAMAKLKLKRNIGTGFWTQSNNFAAPRICKRCGGGNICQVEAILMGEKNRHPWGVKSQEARLLGEGLTSIGRHINEPEPPGTPIQLHAFFKGCEVKIMVRTNFCLQRWSYVLLKMYFCSA